MKWVTRDYVHLDRVASPWLITRFIDPQAEFVFIPWDGSVAPPADATPFGLPGAELGPHDANGTTFQKILARYALVDPALVRMGRVVACGVDYVLHGYRPSSDDADGQIAVGLLSISEGTIYRTSDDRAVLAASFPIYDALYADLQVRQALQSDGTRPPAPGRPGPGDKIDFLRALYRRIA